jgi:hypothetical protein
MSATAYRRDATALLSVDPYNDFLSEGGLVWPRIREVAQNVGLIAAHELNGPAFSHAIVTTSKLIGALPGGRG